MKKLNEHLSRLARHMGRTWNFEGNVLSAGVGSRGRRQDIRCERVGDEYILTSVVLGSTAVTRSHQKWRELARLAWHRNAEHQIVTFAFDERDRLVGQVRHPTDHLDFEELEVYVTALVRECDRFEYLLAGADAF